MNALYTHALRQTQSITSDLALLENSLRPPGSPSLQGDDLNGFARTPSPSLQGNGVDTTGLNGQIVASLAALQRTVDDYENMAKKELIEANKSKAATRVERIKNDYNELRKQYDKVKQTQQTQKQAADRSALFSTGYSTGQNGSTSSMQRRVPQSPGLGRSESPFSSYGGRQAGPSRAGTRSIYTPRTDAALEEHSFINDTGSQLDSFIAQGQAILGNLGTQRDVLKGTQRRLLSAANTLGLSRNTINFIERRGKGDMAVFIAGSITTLICFILIIRYFG